MKLNAEPQLYNEHHNIYTELTGNIYRSVILSLTNVNEKEQEKLYKIIKANTYLFSFLGFHKVIKYKNNDFGSSGHYYKGIRHDVRLDRKKNNVVNIFINGPNAQDISDEILRLVSEKNKESGLEREIMAE